MSTKILIITGGNKNKIADFQIAATNLNLEVTLASFSEIGFESGEEFTLMVGEVDIKEFGVIFVRLVGIRLEEASLVVNYAAKHGIKLVDKVYESALFLPSTISKAIEMAKLIEAKLPLPRTFLASVSEIKSKALTMFGFPFVIKSTSGRKARDAWAPKNQEELDSLTIELEKQEKEGKKFFAQEFIYSTQRERAFVIGDKVVALITRPSKWRKRIREKEGVKAALEITPEITDLALSAANAVGLDIAGIDIMKDEKSGKTYLIEVNAAPAWKLVKKDTGINVEEEILKFLSNL